MKLLLIPLILLLAFSPVIAFAQELTVVIPEDSYNLYEEGIFNAFWTEPEMDKMLDSTDSKGMQSSWYVIEIWYEDVKVDFDVFTTCAGICHYSISEYRDAYQTYLDRLN